MELTTNEQEALKIVFTDYLADRNAHNLKDALGLSSVGTLKLLRRLEEKGLLIGKRMGNAIFYRANVGNDYAMKLLELLFMDHSALTSYVRGWVQELKAFGEAEAVLLFGSVLRVGKDAGDIDACFILRRHEDYTQAQKIVEEMNKRNRKRVHPLYLTVSDLKEKLREKDRPVVEMVRSCVVVSGQALFVRVLREMQS